MHTVNLPVKILRTTILRWADGRVAKSPAHPVACSSRFSRSRSSAKRAATLISCAETPIHRPGRLLITQAANSSHRIRRSYLARPPSAAPW